MTRGIVNIKDISIRECSVCHNTIGMNDVKAWLEQDILNPQIPPEVFHITCAVFLRLSVLWVELRKWDIPDFPGRMYHKRGPLELFEVVRDHLCHRFSLEEWEAERLIRNWSEQL